MNKTNINFLFVFFAFCVYFTAFVQESNAGNKSSKFGRHGRSYMARQHILR